MNLMLHSNSRGIEMGLDNFIDEVNDVLDAHLKYDGPYLNDVIAEDLVVGCVGLDRALEFLKNNSMYSNPDNEDGLFESELNRVLDDVSEWHCMSKFRY